MRSAHRIDALTEVADIARANGTNAPSERMRISAPRRGRPRRPGCGCDGATRLCVEYRAFEAPRGLRAGAAH